MAVSIESSNLPTKKTFINPPIEKDKWAFHEFGNALLGDPRRTERLIKIATERAAKPSCSLPQCFDDKAKLKAAYHFYDNPKINRESILNSHYLATQERLNQENVVLAVSDTTEVDYSHHQSKQGLGYLHDLNHQGFLLHSTLVVTPSKVPLGLLDQQIIYRDEKDFGKKHLRKKRPIEEKESYKWLDSLEAVADVQKNHPLTLIVNVADRESDIYDYFVRAKELDDQALLIRGAWNRCIDDEKNYLWEYIESQDEAGILSVEIPRKPGQAVRTAELSIRYGHVILKPPKHRAKEHLPKVEIDVVLARENNPPLGVEAVEWLLLTTVSVNSLDDAIKRVHWYACRWPIETYHKVLKSGCKIESRQIEAAESLERYLAVDSVVAWRVLGLTMQSRETPDMPGDTFLEEHEWQALACYFQKTSTPPAKPPTLQQATLWIAKLGGFIGRKGDGYPGVTVIWRGLQRLNDITEAWYIFNSF
jgi:hypothetical protein